MREIKKGFDKNYNYSDSIRYSNKNHPKYLRKVERKFAQVKRRRLNKLYKEQDENE